MDNNQLPADAQERIKADAEQYAGLMVWINKNNDPDKEPLFHEHISSTSYIAGATAENERAQVLVDGLELICKKLAGINDTITNDIVNIAEKHLQQWKSGKGVGDGG